MKTLTIVLSLGCFTTVSAAEPVIHAATDPVAPCFHFEQGTVSLLGTIFMRIYFGPPN